MRGQSQLLAEAVRYLLRRPIVPSSVGYRRPSQSRRKYIKTAIGLIVREQQEIVTTICLDPARKSVGDRRPFGHQSMREIIIFGACEREKRKQHRHPITKQVCDKTRICRRDAYHGGNRILFQTSLHAHVTRNLDQPHLDRAAENTSRRHFFAGTGPVRDLRHKSRQRRASAVSTGRRDGRRLLRCRGVLFREAP